MTTDSAPQVHVETRAQWRAWLAEHAATSTGVWAVSWKSSTGRPRVEYDEQVREALCVGWIDSKAKSLDAERSMLWYCRRRPGSGWSRPNKIRIAELERDGLMGPAGRAMIDAAKADGSWTLLDSVENLEVPADLTAAFAARPGSAAAWDAFPRSSRRAMLEWLVTAKRAETRATRVAAIADAAAEGRRAR